MLKQEEPFHCIRCGKPFGVKSTIERVAAKLEGKHWMLRTAQRLDVLKMCEDCRVVALPRRISIPTCPAASDVRTTEDYLREREAQGAGEQARSPRAADNRF